MRFNSYVKKSIMDVKKQTKDKEMDFNKNISDISSSPKNPLSVV